MKIILAGPPRSGKSCLREGLKQAIRRIPGSPYPYVITAAPDGEGSWFQETVNQDPSRAAACKAAYKSGFSSDFVRRVADSVRNCTLPLTLVDIGGIPSVENMEICKYATCIIILAGNDPKTGETWSSRIIPWREFARGLNLAIVAEVFSDYNGQEDTVAIGADGILRGSVHHLERGEPIFERPLVRALGEHLVGLAHKEEVR